MTHSEIMSLNANSDYPIVFVSRNHLSGGNVFYPQSGLLPGMGAHSRFTVTGGRLLIRQADGNITVLVDSTKIFNGIRLIDVQQPNVDYDGVRIVFSGIENRDSSWRIYEIRKDGNGFKKITFSDRNINLSQFGAAASRFYKYDDIDPVFIPDGKIIFSSTRYPSISLYGSALTTNLFIMDSTGANMFRITSERNGAEKPSVDPVTGKILFSRWWVNIDRPSVITTSGITRIDSLAMTQDIANLWQINTILPDGEGLKFFGISADTRASLFSYRGRMSEDGKLYSVFIPHMPMTSTGGSPGIRYNESGLTNYHFVKGVDTSTSLYTSDPPSFGTMMPPYATDPVPLPDGRLIFSFASSVENQDYGIYICNADGSGMTSLIDLPVTLELNAELLVPKRRPPVLEYNLDYDTNKVPPTTDPATFYQGGLFRFDCLNIYSNAPVDSPIGDAPPITKGAKMKFFLNFQRQDKYGLDNPILFREINIDPRGKIAEGDIPANVPMFEQITDSTGKVLKNHKGNIAHVTGLNYGINGSGTKCVGCHAGHTLITVPSNITEGQFTNLSTSAIVTQSSYRFTDSLHNFYGFNVIDRKARNIDLRVNWVALGGTDEYVELSWQTEIDVRNIKLYNISPNTSNGTDISVTDCGVKLYRDNILLREISSTGVLSTDGKDVPVLPMLTVNKIRITVKNFTGNVTNQPVAGLAEIEVNARINAGTFLNSGNNEIIAASYSLGQNYPNPFNPSTEIKFSLAKRENVSLKIFDLAGREIATLIEGYIESGNNSITYSPSSLSSGIYFYTIRAGNFVQTKRMVYLK